MKEKLQNALSEILHFEGDTAQSNNGNIRLTIASPTEATISVTLPEPNNPAMFLMVGAVVTFVSVAAPELPDPETTIKGSCADIIQNNNLLIKNFLGGRLEISFEPQLLVLAFRVLRQ